MTSDTSAAGSRRVSVAAVTLLAALLVVVGAVEAQAGRASEVELQVSEEKGLPGVEAFAEMRPGFASTNGVHPYLAAREQVSRQLRDGPTAPGALEREWVSLGPGNVGGRVRALVIDPRDADVLYAGGVAGGVWKSTDAGVSWRPLTETFANVGVSSIAMDPQDPDVLYVGTGESFGSGHGPGQDGLGGVGIMKTTDAGVTWRLLGDTIDNPNFRWVNDLQVSSSNPDILYVGNRGRVARSIDGGESWESVLSAESPTGCGELALRTDRSPDVLLASCADDGPGGVYRSSDGGDSWTKVIDEFASGDTLIRAGRSAVAFAPSDQDIAYASVARTKDDPRGAEGAMVLLRSNDGGLTWAAQNFGTVNWLGWCDDAEPVGGQGSYSTAIAVDPVDADRVWLGGIDAFRSDDGGRTITRASYWQFIPDTPPPSPGAHADYHAIVFDPGYDASGNQRIYFGTDGGVYRTDNAGAALPDDPCPGPRTEAAAGSGVLYQPLNEGLSVTQFWAGTVSDDGTVVMGGTQDNGTWLSREGAAESAWSRVIGGDGFDVAISPTKDRYYAEIYGHYGIDIRRSIDDGRSFSNITVGAIDDTGLFFTPFVMDPGDPDVLWTGGSHMWRTTDGGDVWKQATANRLPPRVRFSAIGVAPGQTNVVYAGTNSGSVWVSEDALSAMPSWREPDPPVSRYVTAIAVHPDEPQTAFITVAAFDEPQVLKTIDGGASWTAMDDGLPDVPALAVTVNPRNPDMVFVGTDSGVFESPNGGRTWLPANGNLVSTIVHDLVFRPDTSELFLFTHGRGAFRVDVGTGES